MVYVLSMRVLDTQGSAISYDWSYKNRHSEVSHAAFFIAAILSSQAFAEDYVPDAENGAFLHGDHCIDCHMVDNHEALYTRENRIVNERIRLNGQVSACVQVLDLGWFPDEEKDVSEFLNQEYYKF